MCQNSPNEGLEPSTLRLRVWCSTDWASRELSILVISILCLLQWYWGQWPFRSIQTTTKDHKHWFQTRKHMKRNYGSEGVRTLDLRFTRATPYHLATKPGDHWHNPMTYIRNNTSVLSFCVTKYQTFSFDSMKQVALWRNGSASDSRSEGCVFKSRRGQQMFFCLLLASS